MDECVRCVRRGFQVSHPTIQKGLEAVDALFEDSLRQHGLSCGDVRMRSRFLVARQFDVARATELAREVSAWRRVHLPVTVTRGVQVELAKKKVECAGRHLVTGCPILVVRSCRYDPRQRNLHDSVHATLYVLEEALKRDGKGEVCVFYDRTGFEYNKNWDYEFPKALVHVLAQNYPEVLQCVYVYPSGPLLSLLWPIVAKLLDERTKNKVFLSTRDDLLPVVPEDLIRDAPCAR
jgi:hypothetical protein